MRQEKRRFTRVPFAVTAQMLVSGVSYRSDVVHGLSMGGCLLPVSANPEPGSPCRVTIELSGSAQALTVQVEGNVVRCGPDGVAVSFTRIDPDSLFHLKNIIRHNSRDPDRVDRELEDHLGIL